MKMSRSISALLLLCVLLSLLPACSKKLVEPEDHDMSVWTVEKAPTYKKKGVLTRVCLDEGCSYSQSTKVKCAKGLVYAESDEGKLYVTGKGSFDGSFLYISSQTPDGRRVDGIDEEAFMDDPDIRYAYVEDGIKELHGYIFAGCTSLFQARLPAEGELFDFGHFIGCIALKRVSLPEKMTEIPMQFMDGCIALCQISIPETVTSIEFSAFNLCTSLNEVKLPKGLKTVGADAFSACSGLSEIVFPEGLETIRENAFVGCTALKTVILPAGLKELRELAFAHCIGLQKVYIPASVQGIYVSSGGFSPFNYCSKDLVLITDASKPGQGWAENFNVYYTGLSETSDPSDGYAYLQVQYNGQIPTN